MKIVFFPVHCCQFHAKSLEERPLGGTETAIIYLSQELHNLGHDVIVVGHKTSLSLEQPTYLTLSQAAQVEGIDLLVVVRGWTGLLTLFKAKKTFLWLIDAWNNQNTLGIGDRRIQNKIDRLLLLSEWQAKTLMDTSHFPKEKITIFRNGVHLAHFEGSLTRNRARLIYTSTPGRGLKFLPEIYYDLLSKHKNLELHIFSSFKLYEDEWSLKENILDNIYKDLFHFLSQMPGCYLHGSVLQKDLAKEFMQSGIFSYPTDFEETSCISAMEAQAAGCAIVTSDLAALKETVGEAGILIKDRAGKDSYRKAFVEACDRLITDNELFEKFSSAGKQRATGFEWKTRAKELIELIT